MTLFTEDPTYLLWACGAVALACLIALKVTQQGKFLLWAGVCVLVAVLALLVDWLVVTDREKVETVVRDIASAAAAGDAARVLTHLTDDVQIGDTRRRVPGIVMRGFVQSQLEQTKFDFLSLTNMDVQVGEQTGRGTATFRAFGSGSWNQSNFATPPSGTDWSLGVEKTPAGEWKVNRITPTRLPPGFRGGPFDQMPE